MSHSRIEVLKPKTISIVEDYMEQASSLLIKTEIQEMSEILDAIKESKTAEDYNSSVNRLYSLCVIQIKNIEERSNLEQNVQKLKDKTQYETSKSALDSNIISSLKSSIQAVRAIVQTVLTLLKEVNAAVMTQKLLENDFPGLQSRLKEALKNSSSGEHTVKIQKVSTEMDEILKKSTQMNLASLQKIYQDLSAKVAQAEKKPSLLSTLFARSLSPVKKTDEPRATSSPHKTREIHK